MSGNGNTETVRLVHPDGGAVMLELPVAATDAAAIFVCLSDLGFDFASPPTEQPPAIPTEWEGEVCKRCHRANVVGYDIPNEMWWSVVRGRWSVLCLACFDELAAPKLVAWETDIELHPVSSETWRFARASGETL